MSGPAPNLLHSAHSNYVGGVKSAGAGVASSLEISAGDEHGGTFDLFTPSKSIVTEHQQVRYIQLCR
jgi:hypothetical protein